jgi:mRNA-degrading endonuclease YafQ of YafQ-DinJ toxin-antitoxin module
MDAYLHRTFLKRFRKLPLKIQEKFGERLELFLKNPTEPSLNNHSVEKRFPECRSINVTGDYRAIFKLQKDTAIFITIGTHSELY